MLKSLAKYADIGLLIGRIIVGIIFLLFGWRELAGGQPAWARLGHAMSSLGIHLFPPVWGLVAALSEFCGGILLILGFFFRVAALFITITMLVAAIWSFRSHPHDFNLFSRPLEMLAINIVFLFVGPGKYSFDRG
ncbi:MAG: DoxX family protein [Verrucomicrobia bacterium]|nr:DoxX family protein [Verrucomicrobiota bacterium]